MTVSPSSTVSASFSASSSSSVSLSDSGTVSITPSETPSVTWTVTPSTTGSDTVTVSCTVSGSPSSTSSFTASATDSLSFSTSATGSPTVSVTTSGTPSFTLTGTVSATASGTGSETATTTPTISWTASSTGSATSSATATSTLTPTVTATATSTRTITPTVSPSPSAGSVIVTTNTLNKTTFINVINSIIFNRPAGTFSLTLTFASANFNVQSITPIATASAAPGGTRAWNYNKFSGIITYSDVFSDQASARAALLALPLEMIGTSGTITIGTGQGTTAVPVTGTGLRLLFDSWQALEKSSTADAGRALTDASALKTPDYSTLKVLVYDPNDQARFPESHMAELIRLNGDYVFCGANTTESVNDVIQRYPGATIDLALPAEQGMIKVGSEFMQPEHFSSLANGTTLNIWSCADGSAMDRYGFGIAGEGMVRTSNTTTGGSEVSGDYYLEHAFIYVNGTRTKTDVLEGLSMQGKLVVAEEHLGVYIQPGTKPTPRNVEEKAAFLAASAAVPSASPMPRFDDINAPSVRRFEYLADALKGTKSYQLPDGKQLNPLVAKDNYFNNLRKVSSFLNSAMTEGEVLGNYAPEPQKILRGNWAAWSGILYETQQMLASLDSYHFSAEEKAMMSAVQPNIERLVAHYEHMTQPTLVAERFAAFKTEMKATLERERQEREAIIPMEVLQGTLVSAAIMTVADQLKALLREQERRDALGLWCKTRAEVKREVPADKDVFNTQAKDSVISALGHLRQPVLQTERYEAQVRAKEVSDANVNGLFVAAASQLQQIKALALTGETQADFEARLKTLPASEHQTLRQIRGLVLSVASLEQFKQILHPMSEHTLKVYMEHFDAIRTSATSQSIFETAIQCLPEVEQGKWRQIRALELTPDDMRQTFKTQFGEQQAQFSEVRAAVAVGQYDRAFSTMISHLSDDQQTLWNQARSALLSSATRQDVLAFMPPYSGVIVDQVVRFVEAEKAYQACFSGLSETRRAKWEGVRNALYAGKPHKAFRLAVPAAEQQEVGFEAMVELLLKTVSAARPAVEEMRLSLLKDYKGKLEAQLSALALEDLSPKEVEKEKKCIEDKNKADFNAELGALREEFFEITLATKIKDLAAWNVMDLSDDALSRWKSVFYYALSANSEAAIREQIDIQLLYPYKLEMDALFSAQTEAPVFDLVQDLPLKEKSACQALREQLYVERLEKSLQNTLKTLSPEEQLKWGNLRDKIFAATTPEEYPVRLSQAIHCLATMHFMSQFRGVIYSPEVIEASKWLSTLPGANPELMAAASRLATPGLVSIGIGLSEFSQYRRFQAAIEELPKAENAKVLEQLEIIGRSSQSKEQFVALVEQLIENATLIKQPESVVHEVMNAALDKVVSFVEAPSFKAIEGPRPGMLDFLDPVSDKVAIAVASALNPMPWISYAREQLSSYASWLTAPVSIDLEDIQAGAYKSGGASVAVAKPSALDFEGAAAKASEMAGQFGSNFCKASVSAALPQVGLLVSMLTPMAAGVWATSTMLPSLMLLSGMAMGASAMFAKGEGTKTLTPVGVSMALSALAGILIGKTMGDLLSTASGVITVALMVGKVGMLLQDLSSDPHFKACETPENKRAFVAGKLVETLSTLPSTISQAIVQWAAPSIAVQLEKGVDSVIEGVKATEFYRLGAFAFCQAELSKDLTAQQVALLPRVPG